MALSRKGKISILLFLFISSRLSFSISLSDAVTKNAHENEIEIEIGKENDPLTPSDFKPEHERESDPLNHVDRQEIQLQKLEDLVKNLTETVSRLESSLSGLRDPRPSLKEQLRQRHAESSISDAVGGIDYSLRLSDGAHDGDDDDVDVRSFKPNSREGEKRDRAITVTKYKPSWSERFQFLSAVKLEFEATCVNVLPHEDYEGFSKYIAVGDDRGRVYIFLSNGDVLVEFYTLSDSPITSMLSYMSIWKNESVLVTGHQDGTILVHRLWEASSSEDWHSLSMGNSHAFNSLAEGEQGSPVMILETHLLGRMRYIMSSDMNGRIKVFLQNGTLYGTAVLPSRPLVFLKQRLLFLTERGAGSLDLRSMTIREAECEGLNGSIVRNYIFDALERSKAYGFTTTGDLILVVLLGDIMNFKCMVRAKRKTEMTGPLAVHVIKGYLLVVSQERVYVYNVSSPNYIRGGGPRPLFFATLDEIKSSFLSSLATLETSGSQKPLVSSDREKLVVLGLGGGYIGMYRSNLPVFKAEFNTVLWSSPVVLCILFLIGAWQFLGKKREPLTPWGSDDPFSATSVTTGGSLGSVSGDRTYSDSSRPDLRGAALRGPSRRYVSPSRYPGGAATSFRPATGDTSYRAATELTYRGQNLDIAGFPKRRDPLFPNSQVGEDNIK